MVWNSNKNEFSSNRGYLFTDDFDMWLAEVERLEGIVEVDDDGVYRAYNGLVKVGCFGKLPGHGFYLMSKPK